jgi:hypothetical protein
MEHVLDTNRRIAAVFVSKALEFINLPISLFECDIKKCNPDLYKGLRGKTVIRRSRKSLAILKRVKKDLNKVHRILYVSVKKKSRRSYCKSCFVG